MNKALVLRIVNIVLFISFIIQGVTGIIMFLELNFPHVKLVYEAHEYNGILLVIVVVMHVALNWGWVRANILKKK